MSESVCLSLRSHMTKTTCPNFTYFSVCVTCGCGSVLLWPQYAMHFRFCGDVMFPIMDHITWLIGRRPILKVIHQVTALAAKCDVYDSLAYSVVSNQFWFLDVIQALPTSTAKLWQYVNIIVVFNNKKTPFLQSAMQFRHMHCICKAMSSSG